MARTTARSLERCHIGKLGISVATMDQVLQAMVAAAQERRPAYVCVANIQTVVVSQNDAEFCRIQNESLLTVPDGMPLVWFARMAGVRDIRRVTGPDIMLETLRMSPHHGHTHYFYGDTDATLQEIRKVVRERFPGTVILGTYSPPFRELTDAEVDATVEEINRLRPSFVWVGLGCPKQELWIGRVFPRIESSVLVGVGAAFRFLIGEYRHPPKVFQGCGLEGMFWRGLRRPVYCARYYARNLPTYGRLFLRQLAFRVTNRGHSALRPPRESVASGVAAGLPRTKSAKPSGSNRRTDRLLRGGCRPWRLLWRVRVRIHRLYLVRSHSWDGRDDGADE